MKLSQRKVAAGRESRPATAGRRSLDQASEKLALVLLGVLVVLTPLVVAPDLREAFRLPKRVLAESLGLTAALVLALGACLRGRAIRESAQLTTTTAPVDRLRALFVVACAAYLAIASAGLLHSEHQARTEAALLSLAIASVVGVVLIHTLTRQQLARSLEWSVVPGVLLSVIVLAQALDLYHPFAFNASTTERAGLTSLAGNPGDLSAFLILPILVAISRLFAAAHRRGRTWWLLALIVQSAGLLATRTFSTLAAVAVAAGLLVTMTIGRRRALLVAVLLCLAGLVVAVGWGPLRERVLHKGKALANGDINEVLTGRLDGWRVALELGAGSPWTGIGVGGYGAEFAPTRLALMERGVPFYEGHTFSTFANAHSEPLEIFAESGVPGLLVATLMLLLVARACRHAAADPTTRVAIAFLGGVLVLTTAAFPLRIAITAWPALLAAAVVLARVAHPESDDSPDPLARAREKPV